MNTINIYLATSGQNALVAKDFPLYQGSYQNKLIDIYVPTSIISAQFTSSDSSFVAGTAVKIGMTYTARNGSIKTSQNYYVRYLKTLTYNNVEYAMYERQLPQEFTFYAGQNASAPLLIANVVNISVPDFISADETYIGELTVDTLPSGADLTAQLNAFVQDTKGRSPLENDVVAIYVEQQGQAVAVYKYVFTSGAWVQSEVVAVITNITTSQTCALEVMPSSSLDNDGTLDASELELMQAQLNALVLSQEGKQDKADDNLNTTSKSVVGAINELKTNVDTNTTNIATNTANISTNTSDIACIKANYSQGENYIGQLEGTTLPTDEQLTQFVVDNTSPSRQPKNSDVIVFILQQTGTDLNYKYVYTETGWQGYEIPATQPAENTAYGLVKGSLGSGNAVEVDINNGIITDIQTLPLSGVTPTSIKNQLQASQQTDANIISGTQQVGLANKATNDGNGNNIANTYLSVASGASKTYVKNYALPRQFNDVLFIASSGYQDDVPTTPASGIQFSVDTASVGDFTLFSLTQLANAEYELSNKNSSQNIFYVTSNVTTTAYFRLSTQVQINSVWQDLVVELSDLQNLTAGEIAKLTFGSTFNSLNGTVLNIAEDTVIRQVLEVVTQASTATTFSLYSNITYPSTFTLNTQALKIITVSGNLGQQPVYNGTGTLQGNVLTFTMNEDSDFNANTEGEFILTYTGTEELASTIEIQLAFNQQGIRLATPYNFLSGNATVGNLSQINQEYSATSGTVFTFKGFIDIDIADNITVIVDEDNLSDFATINYVNDQDIAYIGREQQVDFDAVLQNNQIIGSLEQSISTFEFTSGTGYLFHINLPLVTLSGLLDNSYPMYLQDASGKLININCVFQKNISLTSTVGNLCQLQDYDVGIGYSWEFYGHYAELNNNGTLVRVVYTDTVVRETNASMTGADFNIAIGNSTLKVGTTVLITETFNGSGYDYLQGHTYLVEGTWAADEVFLSAVDISTFIDYANPQTLTTTQQTQALDNLGANALFATQTELESTNANVADLFTILQADNIIVENTVEDKYQSRVSGGGLTIIDGVQTTVNKIQGNTVKCDNLISTPYYSGTSKTVAGITFTVNADGSITANGISNSLARFYLTNSFILSAGTYSFSGCPTGGGGTTYNVQVYSNTTSQDINDVGVGRTVTFTQDVEIIINVRIQENQTVNNLIFKPMLVKSDVIPTTYQPYFTGLKNASVGGIVSTGKNLVSLDTYRLNYVASGSNKIVMLATNSPQYNSTFGLYVPCEAGEYYYFKIFNNSVGVDILRLSWTMEVPDLEASVLLKNYLPPEGESIVAPELAKYCFIELKLAEGQTATEEVAASMQVMASTGTVIPSAYEPYKTSTLALLETIELKEYDYIDLDNQQLVVQSATITQATPFTAEQLAQYTEYVLSADGLTLTYKTTAQTITPYATPTKYIEYTNGTETIQGNTNAEYGAEVTVTQEIITLGGTN